MNYGMQISASGALTAMYRQDVYTNNLANASTIGFKPVLPQTRQRDAARIEDDLPFLPSNALLETLGGGVQMAPNHISFAQGDLQVTDEPLDLAIQGEGFLVLQAPPNGEGDRLRLTRDGRLTLDRDGRLVRAADGLPVLDGGGREITLPPNVEVSIDENGGIRASGREIARLMFVNADPASLRAVGHGCFAPVSGAVDTKTAARGTIHQGMVEGSGVDEFDAMMKIADAGRAAATNLGMISYHDQIMGQAINGLGRIA